MPVTLGLTESQVMTVLRSFLLAILPEGIEVIQAEDNRVPEPEAADFVVMTPLLRRRLSTNVSTYVDDGASGPVQTRTDTVPTELTVQTDVHGPNSGDNVQIITTLFRSSYATEQMAASGYVVQPLFASEPRQTQFSDSEQQVERRWGVDLVMQANMAVTVDQDFADTVNIGLISVDVAYPPGV